MGDRLHNADSPALMLRGIRALLATTPRHPSWACYAWAPFEEATPVQCSDLPIRHVLPRRRLCMPVNASALSPTGPVAAAGFVKKSGFFPHDLSE